MLLTTKSGHNIWVKVRLKYLTLKNIVFFCLYRCFFPPHDILTESFLVFKLALVQKALPE